MGRSASTDAVRDNMINYAQGDVYDRYPFSWLLKTTTITLASGVASLPADYNPKFMLKDARIVNASTGDDDIFQQIMPEERDDFGTDSEDRLICWITYKSSDGTYSFNSNQTTGTVTIYYYNKPGDLTADADYLVCPDPMAVAYKAAAMLWIAKERDETNHDRFDKIAENKISALIGNDKLANPVPFVTGLTDHFDLGYNETRKTRPDYGYQSRG